MDIKHAVDVLGALAHASRLSVFRQLVQRGLEGATPGEVAEALTIPNTTLSFHLKALSHAGLIEAEQNGRSITYRANFDRAQELVDFLTQSCCGGDLRKCAPKTASAAKRSVGGR